MVLYYAPKEKLSPEIIKRIKTANEDRKKHNFAWYVRELSDIFDLKSNPRCDGSYSVTKDDKTFFSGFLLGEGSINVSAKKQDTSRFGIVLDLEFSVVQHVNGVSYLFLALGVFKTGTIRYKTSSPATIEYRMDNRESLENKVIPFYENYCSLYWSEDFEKRFGKFKRLISLFNKNAHSDIDSFCDEMLPLWSGMIKQEGQKNAAFASLVEAKAYARTHHKNKIK